MTPAGQPDGTATQTQEPGSCLSPWQRDNLADGLLAIGNAIASDPEAQAHSLNHWLTWLDEEGYDPDGLMEALTALGQHHLTAEAWQQLQAAAGASAAAPNGIDSAAKHLDQHHPALLEAILTIEQARQQQLETLQSRAGGMNKVLRNSLISAAVGTSLGLTIGYILNRRDAKKIADIQARIDRAETATEYLIKADKDVEELGTGDLTTPKTVRLLKPLISMSENEIVMHAGIAYKGHFKIAEQTDLLSDVKTRLLKGHLPEKYLEGLNQWIDTAEGKAAKESLRLDRDANHVYKEIREVDRTLRLRYEESTFARDFIKGLHASGTLRDTGMQSFTAVAKDYYKLQLQKTQTLLKDKAEAGDFTEEEHFLNSHFTVDFSPDAIRSVLSDHFETAYRGWLDRHGVWDRMEDVKAAWKEKYPEAAHQARADSQSKAVLSDFEKGLITEEERVERIRKISNELYDFKADLRITRSEFIFDVIKPMYLAERDEILKSISSALDLNDSELADKLRRDLEDLEDFPSWLNDKADELGHKFDHFVESEKSNAARSLKKALTNVRTEADQMMENEIKRIEIAGDDAVEDLRGLGRDIVDVM